MNYLTYFVLVLLLTHTVGPTGTGVESNKLQRLFDIMQSHFSECPEEPDPSFYTCPSHLWPEILQNFIPMTKSLRVWIRRRLSIDADIWCHLVRAFSTDVFQFDEQSLVEIRDEFKTWTLLNHYLKLELDQLDTNDIYECLLATLDSLTDVDLGLLSQLPYGGNSDRFGEINELVNDPKKARLLDGLKRASRDDLEMSRMLKSLRRWLKREDLDIRAIIYFAGREKDIGSIPVDQLHAKPTTVPNFKGDKELENFFTLTGHFNIYAKFEQNKSMFQESLPQSFSNRDNLIDFLTRVGNDAEAFRQCKWAIESTLKELQGSILWDKVVTYNEYMMKGLSKLPDEFFEAYAKLNKEERNQLHDMLRGANLPTLASVL